MEASIRLDTARHVGEIDRRIFSGFLEHMGRAIYKGIYDPGSPLSDANGFRTDVGEALRRLGMPYMRYPGGNFVSNYDWRDGVGPQDRRPVRPDFAWRSIEPNTFGVDEFVDWCRWMDIEPMMAVNLGTLGPREAAELVEYCNFPGGTHWSDARRQNGNSEPYGIDLWCLGNEMDGPWQAGHCSAEAYAGKAQQAARLMRGIDPAIELVACGSSGRYMESYLEWDRVVLESCWEEVAYISAHRYSRNSQDDSAWFLAEGVEIDRVLNDYAGLLAYVRGVKRSDRQVYVAFDEWNVWYKDRKIDGAWSPAPHLIEEVYNLEDALVCAQFLNSFLRHADIVKIACLAQVVNVIAPILTKPDGMLIQSIYYPLQLFSQHAQGLSLTPIVDGPTYTAGSRGEVPVLDVTASYHAESNSVCVFLVNRSLTDDVEVQVSFGDRRATAALKTAVLTGGDPKAHNTWEEPNVVRPNCGSSTVDASGQIDVVAPSLGLTVVRVRLEEKN
ncbi:MAG: alpha-N-arabinofuranosidase [Chloroflexi bacterium]|nr:alpha-N-arabinofuranosidase [Chloroflexota bacterium]